MDEQQTAASAAASSGTGNGPDLSALCAQLGILDETLWRIAIILIGVGLSYRATMIQRGQLVKLICGDTSGQSTDVAPMRITSALLVLSSLFFFLRLSRRTLCDAQTESAQCSAQIDYTGNLLVVSVALARLWDLFRRLPESAAALEAQAQEPLAAEAGAVDSAL